MDFQITLTLILVILTGLISYQAFENRSMRDKLIMHPVSVKEFGQWYRLFTSGFIHGDWGHLLINMFVLYQFGEMIENLFMAFLGPLTGRIAFLALYLGAIIISSVPSYLKHQDNTYYAALGASGGTSAIVFAFIIFAPWQMFLFPPVPAIVFGVGYIAYSSYMDQRGTDNIGHSAHLWGAVYGLAFTLILLYFFMPNMLTILWHQLLNPSWGQ